MMISHAVLLCYLISPWVSPLAAHDSAWTRIAPFFEPPAEFAGDFGDYRDWIHDSAGRPLSAQQWSERRNELRAYWRRRLGEFPPLIKRPRVYYERLELREGGVRQYRVHFLLAPGHPHHAYLLLPDHAPVGAAPAVVTVFYEPETAIGLQGEHRDFAIQLARRGFVTLSVGHDYSLYFPDQDHATLQPLAALAGAAANAYYVVASRPEVDPRRVGVLGHSYGGKWAMFAAALYDEFACGAWSDPGIVFDDTRASINYWEPWYLGYDGPNFRARGLPTAGNPARGLYPIFRTAGRDLIELHLMLPPRPFFVSGGAEDPPSRWRALNHSVALNRQLGFANRVGMSNRAEHSPNPASNEHIYDFFTHFLIDEAP